MKRSCLSLCNTASVLEDFPLLKLPDWTANTSVASYFSFLRVKTARYEVRTPTCNYRAEPYPHSKGTS